MLSPLSTQMMPLSATRRVESGFNPASISGLALFLKNGVGVEKAAGVAASVGEGISSWLDQSGNGFHATQSDSSKRPALASNGISFDGVDDYLKNSTLNLSAPFTQFIFAKINETGNGVLTDSDGPTQCATYLGDGFTSNEPLRVARGNGGSDAGTITRGVFHVIMVEMDTTITTVRVDGVERFSSNSSGTNGLDGLRIGDIRASLVGGYQFEGIMEHLIIYNRILTSEEKTLVEAY